MPHVPNNRMKFTSFLALLITQLAYCGDDRSGRAISAGSGTIFTGTNSRRSTASTRFPRKSELDKPSESIRAKDLRLHLPSQRALELYADPYDPAAYSRFAAWLAQKFAGKIHAIEICNEPNYGWGILGLMGSQSFPAFVNEWRAQARKYKTTTAMWLTESGTSTFTLPSGFVVTEQMQAQW